MGNAVQATNNNAQAVAAAKASDFQVSLHCGAPTPHTCNIHSILSGTSITVADCGRFSPGTGPGERELNRSVLFLLAAACMHALAPPFGEVIFLCRRHGTGRRAVRRHRCPDGKLCAACLMLTATSGFLQRACGGGAGSGLCDCADAGGCQRQPGCGWLWQHGRRPNKRQREVIGTARRPSCFAQVIDGDRSFFFMMASGCSICAHGGFLLVRAAVAGVLQLCERLM